MSSTILSHSHNVVVDNLTSFSSANAVHYHTTSASGHGSNYSYHTLSCLTDHVVADALHNAKARYDEPKCHPETRVAVQQNILTWITDGDGEKVLWITGPAGTGKTAIASTIASICEERGLLAASFFFSGFAGSVYRQSKERVVPTIAYQLFQRCRVMKGIDRKILASIERDPLIFQKCLSDQFRSLVLEPLHELIGEGVDNTPAWPKIVIFDGVDECMADVGVDETISKSELRRRTEVVHEEIISLLSSAAQTPSFPFRVLVASRPEPVISNFFSIRAPATLKIFLDDEYDASGDITLFLQSKFGEIRRRYHLPSGWPAGDIVTLLVERASGQFIYAATIIRYIENSDDLPQVQLQRICEWRSGSDALSPECNPFASLDVLYARILESSPKPSLAIKWIAAIRLFQDETPSSKDIFIKYFLEAMPGEMGFLLGNLSSLISVGDHESPRFRIYHQSLPEFLSDSTRSRRLHVNQEDLRLFLKERCEQVLRHKGPQCSSFNSASELAEFLAWCEALQGCQDNVYTTQDSHRCPDDTNLDYQTSKDGLAESSRPVLPLIIVSPPPLPETCPPSDGHTYRDLMHLEGYPIPSIITTRSSGIIILLLGRSGDGKRHFINAVAGKSIVPVNWPKESGVRHFTLDNPLDPSSPDKLIMVDTPGFDIPQKHADGAMILDQISEWFTTRCSLDARFGGVIYFYDITQDRGGWEFGQIWPAGYLAAPEPVRHLILATVKWDPVGVLPYTVDFEEREKTLATMVWRRMLDQGARLVRFENTRDSAVALLAQLLELQPLDLRVMHMDLERIRHRKVPVAPKKMAKGFNALYKWFK